MRTIQKAHDAALDDGVVLVKRCGYFFLNWSSRSHVNSGPLLEFHRTHGWIQTQLAEEQNNETRTEGSSKRAGDELESDNSKKEKIDEHVEAKKDDDQKEAKMKKNIEIVKDDEIAIDAIPLATKPPVIVKYKIVK
ncbi:hypothetical protein Tco_1409617 [Tanacetum coccineum]